jgi:hypothetical protein
VHGREATQRGYHGAIVGTEFAIGVSDVYGQALGQLLAERGTSGDTTGNHNALRLELVKGQQ